MPSRSRASETPQVSRRARRATRDAEAWVAVMGPLTFRLFADALARLQLPKGSRPLVLNAFLNKLQTARRQFSSPGGSETMTSTERSGAPARANPQEVAGWEAALRELQHQAAHLEARGAMRAA